MLPTLTVNTIVKRGDFDNNLDIARQHVVWATTPSYKRDMLQ